MSDDEYTTEEREEIYTLARGLVQSLGPRKAQLLTNVMNSVMAAQHDRGQDIVDDTDDQEVEDR